MVRTHSSTGSALEGIRAVSLKDLEGLRAEWLFLRDRHGMPSVETDPDHFSAIVRAMGNPVEPYVTLFRDNSGPRALIVGRISRRPVVYRFGYLKFKSPQLRCLDVVHGGLITDRERRSSRSVVEHLSTLLGTGQLDHIRINHLPTEHECFTNLSSSRQARYLAVQHPVEPHWQIELVPGRYEEVFKRFSKKQQRTLQRESRRLHDHFHGALELCLLRDHREMDSIIAWASQIAAQTYQAGLGVGLNDTPVWRALLSSAAKRAALRAWFLKGQGRPIAFLIGTVYKDTCFLTATGYLPDFAPLSPGKHLHLRSYECLCQENIRFADYGFGDAQDKRVFGTRSWSEATLHLYRRTPSAWFLGVLDATAVAASGLSARALRSVGVLGKVKKSWRARKRVPFRQRCGQTE